MITEKNTTALNDQNPDSNIGDAAQEMLAVAENEEVLENTEIQGSHFPDYSNKSLKEITQIFEEMIERGDQQELYKYADSLKAAFYKVLKKEKIASGLFHQEGETVAAQNEGEEQSDTVSNNPFAEIERGFKDLYAKYKSARAVYLQEQEKIKEENLAKKLEIIEELKTLLDKQEDVNHTFPAFRELQNRWKSISMVPQNRAKDLWETYQHCVEKFYDYIKINNEFRDLDFKKNLEAKIALCEKAEALENESNVVTAFRELQKLHEEWKELGPVDKEHREQIWERFKAITSVINKKHQHFFERLKEDQKNNLEQKNALCEQAEELAAKEVVESNQWNALSKQMDELQTKWKSIGFAAKKENQKVYDRFRAACDKFYNAKREYYANFKNVMQENLKKKEELCEQAEALMHSEDWKKTTDQLIGLQKTWKEIGPVARKQSDIVWKRFRAACDFFFENKAKHFGKEDEKFEENLSAKKALIEEISGYRLSESKDENIEAMRAFQSRWNEIGFVPFKEKDKIQEEYNKAMDAHFADIRSLESEKNFNKFRKKVSDIKSSGKGDRPLKMERDRLIQKFRKMESDIATLENNMGFFAKSKNADIFIAEMQKKIEIARQEMAQVEEKIKLIEKEFE